MIFVRDWEGSLVTVVCRFDAFWKCGRSVFVAWMLLGYVVGMRLDIYMRCHCEHI